VKYPIRKVPKKPSKTYPQMPVIITEDMTKDKYSPPPKQEDIKELIQVVQTLSDKVENKTNQLIERLDLILSAR